MYCCNVINMLLKNIKLCSTHHLFLYWRGKQKPDNEAKKEKHWNFEFYGYPPCCHMTILGKKNICHVVLLKEKLFQNKQSIESLVVLNEEQEGLLAFLKSSKLTPAQIIGSKEYLVAPVVWWPFKEGTTLVPLEIVPVLPMEMRRLHDCYMQAMSNLNFMQGAKFTDDDFLRGEGMIWLNWEEIYQLYHQDTLDISIVSLWLL